MERNSVPRRLTATEIVALRRDMREALQTMRAKLNMPSHHSHRLGSGTMTHITVGQLIEQLKAFPESLPVMLPGYETGYDDVLQMVVVRVKKDTRERDWAGSYKTSQKSGFQALFIRGRHGCMADC